MKYVFIILGLTILSLYAVLDNRLKAIQVLENDLAIKKIEIGYRTAAINLLEDYRKALKPPRIIPYPWPMIPEEYDNVTSYWALRNDPLRRDSGGNDTPFHNGIDMTGIEGAQVLTIANGVVLNKYYEKGVHYVNGKWREYGGHKYFNGYIEILHDNGMISHYGHIAEILVHEGDRVKAGQQIAQISEQRDKFSTGSHLDFRLEIAGEYVNPLLWIGGSEK